MRPIWLLLSYQSASGASGQSIGCVTLESGVPLPESYAALALPFVLPLQTDG